VGVPAALTIAIDAMGGDLGPDVAVPGAARALDARPGTRFVLFGDSLRIERLLAQHPALAAVAEVAHTDRVVAPDDKPSAVLRNAQGTSMRAALEAVAEGRAAAAVSGGNTGALMALAKSVLRPLPGIHRPAIASIFPALTGRTIMLDLGANVLVEAEHLVQFALLGALFARAHTGATAPRVGLLNVGSEPSKGPDHVRMAGQILSQIEMPARYVGFVEGHDITAGTVDVVVCDGYAGNIALKTAEGVGRLTGRFFKDALAGDPLSALGGALAYFGLRRFKRRVDPRLYNGGVFLGLGGLCVKSHGGSDAVGFATAVGLAAGLAAADYTAQLSAELANFAGQDDSLLRA
jgi:phosphate acyltransferase